MIEFKKFMVFLVITILLLSGFFILMDYQSVNHNNTKQNPNSSIIIFQENNIPYEELTFNNTTILLNLNTFRIVNSTTQNGIVEPYTTYTLSYETFYFYTSSNIGTLPCISGITNKNGNKISDFYSKIQFTISGSQNYNFSSTFLLPLSNSGGVTSLTVNLNSSIGVKLNKGMSYSITTNSYYYFSGSNTYGVQSNYYVSPQTVSDILNLTYSTITFTFTNVHNYFTLTINNQLANGNITISNTSGYDNSYKLSLSGSLVLEIQNGTYSYSFSYMVNGTKEYQNKSFNITGLNKQITITLNPNSTQLYVLTILFISLNILLILSAIYIFKIYYALIPIQALFFIVGYYLSIDYYQFYFISLLILVIALEFGTTVMKKVGD